MAKTLERGPIPYYSGWYFVNALACGPGVKILFFSNQQSARARLWVSILSIGTIMLLTATLWLTLPVSFLVPPNAPL